MSRLILDTIFRVFGIRGRIPGGDDFDGGPADPALTGNTGRLAWILAVLAIILALLSVVWAAVWLSIKSV